jgi:hypothetical protein
MKKVTIFAVAALMFLLARSAHAALHDHGNGLIYDDVLDITWMQDANYAGITMTWNDAASWVDSLVFQGYDDWRLPDTDTSCTGKSCTGSEMGDLFYNSFITSENPGLFSDVKGFIYWSGTEDTTDPMNAWRFSFKYGTQDVSTKTSKRYAWAVRDGEPGSPVAPEPVSTILFIAGGTTIGLRKLWQKNTVRKQMRQT